MNFNNPLRSGFTLLTSISVACPASGALLLSDNFTADMNVRAGALDYNIADRQTGSVATTDYFTGPGANPNIQLGNTTTLRTGGDGNYLLTAFNAKGSPNRNFNGALSLGGLEISFDVSANFRSATNNTNWTALNIGMSEANRLAGVNGSEEHFGLLFRGDGRTQAFDGSTVLPGSEVRWSPVEEGGVDNFNSVRFLFTDPGDNNPFDGVGVTQVDVFSDLIGSGAAPIFSFTKNDGGYTDNFISFTSNDIGGIDNLSISQIPEPSVPLLGGLGMAFALLTRRRTS